MTAPRGIPTLDQIAENPDVVADLPREALVQLTERATLVHTRLMLRIYTAAMTAPAAAEHEQLVDVTEVARIFNVSVSTVQHKAKTFPYSLFLVPGTRPMMFSRSRIDRYIRQHAGREGGGER